MAELRELTDRERLVTLVGPPGCGKTRLGIEAARGPNGPTGVSFVDLASVSDPHLVLHTVGVAMGLQQRFGVAMEDTVIEALGSTEPRLVVLDNCEHVIGAASRLAGLVVSSCPAVRVMTTSRVRLNLMGEEVWGVPPLGTASAVELFVDRARLVSSQGWGEDAHGGLIRAICSRLDGLPLAIELAAAWVRMLSLGEIVDRLDQALLLLSSGGPRGAARHERHETMGATVEWSYRLLAPADQALFQELSVFAGGFDLDAAEVVAGPGVDVLSGLVRLVDQSLVVTEPTPGGPMRYRVLEAVRQYGMACLVASGGDAAVRRRHADHYQSLARRCDPFGIRDERPKLPFSRLVLDEGNVLAAVEWARAEPADVGLRLCVALAPFWEFRGPLNDGRAWLEAMLALGTTDDDLRIAALWCAGKLAWRQGDQEGAGALFERGLEIAQGAGDEWWVAHLRARKALAALSAGDAADATALCEQSVAVFRARDDDVGLLWSWMVLGWARYMEHDVARGDEAMQAALTANRSLANHTAAAQGLFGLAYGAFLAEDTPAQRAHLLAALDEMRQAGGCVDESDWLGCAGALAAREGRLHAALRVIGGSLAFRLRTGSQFPARIAAPIEELVVEVIDAVGAPVAERLLAEGGRMTLDDLVGDAMGRTGGDDRHRLSRRERQVADLVGRGLTNVEVAAQLSISRRTVETHVDHIKQKLHVPSRQQVMAWALREFTE